MYQLDEISKLVDRCDAFLKGQKITNPEIENIMTCYLLVHICGEYEKLIKSSIVERATSVGDDDLAKYLSTKAFRPIRSLFLSELTDNILKNFGQSYVDSFELKKKTLGDKAITSYSNIVTNRHRTAHGQPINYTFKDLVASTEDSNHVVNALLEVLAP